jgi:opacity protein-like surface antigen
MRRIYLLLPFLCLPAMLPAQSFEGAVSGGVSQIRNGDIGSGYTLDDGFRLAFRMSFNTKKYTGFEVGYAYNRTHLGLAGQDSSQNQGMAIHQGFGDFLIHATGEGSRFRPFAAAGLGFSNFVPPGQTAQYGQGETKFGFNYGGGLKVKVAGPWQVRFDIRQYNTGVPFGMRSGRFLQNEISAGVGFTL